MQMREETELVSIMGAGHPNFRVAKFGEGSCTLASYNRRDFYKVTLVIKCDSELLYADRGVIIDRPALVFVNPLIPYSWATKSDAGEISGGYCVFTEDFLQADGRTGSIVESVLFRPGGDHVFFLDDKQLVYVSDIFDRMREEAAGEYVYKYDVIRSQLHLLMHEAVKMQPAIAYFTPGNAAGRISRLFTALLHQQFPLDLPRQSLQLRKASDYARQLSVHVNHLNAAVQTTTGKSTTTHINEQIVAEAKSMLLHSELSVAEIAEGLGFEYASYFNNFFKKQTGVTPLSVRKNL